MEKTRWNRISDLFLSALELEPAEQRAFLDEACAADPELRAELDALLASDQGARQQLEQVVADAGAELDKPETLEGQTIGPYLLVRQIGSGGMGTVYHGIRADGEFLQAVAVKVIKRGMDSASILKRFRQERQILARLSHPNIARLLDGGTTDSGQPYLVMEYVDGRPITHYADEQKLSLRDILKLFVPVCEGVQAAHRNLIVHRDLKPGNILVSADGVPKLLDFGIAKLLDPELATDELPATATGVYLLTPEYASPEQVRGEPVSTATDVYSLGAVFYELLTRRKPHVIGTYSPKEIERAVCLSELQKPSTISSDGELAGDLDNIVLMAMRKEPERRYASAGEMADDIRRYLEYRPVVARPDSFSYRAGKFVRRNRVAVALSALVMGSLIGGAAVALRQARIAAERFDQVRKLATTFVFDVDTAARDLPGSLRVRQLIARTGLEYLDKLSRSAGSDWDLKRELATAYMRIGEVQGGQGNSNLGDAAGALESFRHAEQLLDSVLSHSPADRKAAEDRMTVTHRVSNVHRRMGQIQAAIDAGGDGLRRADTLLQRFPDDVDLLQYAIVFHIDLGRLRQQTGDLNGAAHDIGESITLLRKVLAARPEDREAVANAASAQARLGSIHADLGKRQEALESYRAGASLLEGVARRLPNDANVRHELMLAYSHVGDVLGNPHYDSFGDSRAALVEYRKVVPIAQALHDADVNDLRAKSDLGIALLRLGTVSPPAEKLPILQKAYELLEAVRVKNPKDRTSATHKAWAELEIADALLAQGNRPAAMHYYASAMATAEAVQALEPLDTASHRWLILAGQNLAQCQIRSGDRAGAVATIERILQLARRVDAQRSHTSFASRATVARAWQATGNVYALAAAHTRGREDREAARQSYARAVQEWRALKTRDGFTAFHKREMEAVDAALSALDGTA